MVLLSLTNTCLLDYCHGKTINAVISLIVLTIFLETWDERRVINLFMVLRLA